MNTFTVEGDFIDIDPPYLYSEGEGYFCYDQTRLMVERTITGRVKAEMDKVSDRGVQCMVGILSDPEIQEMILRYDIHSVCVDRGLTNTTAPNLITTNHST